MTSDQARTKLSKANVSSAVLDVMSDDDLIALASMVKVKGPQGPTMADRIEEALESIGKPVLAKELFKFMVEHGLATDGSNGTIDQFDGMYSNLSKGRNKDGSRRFVNPAKGVWALPTPEEVLKSNIKAKLTEVSELETLETLWSFLNEG
jgi:hypothetical protein